MTPRIMRGVLAASLVYIGALVGGGNFVVQTLCAVVISVGFFVAGRDRRRTPSSPAAGFSGCCRC